MSLFVDTSVWSLALRRDVVVRQPEVDELVAALDRGEQIVTTGLVLQELLQGFAGPRSKQQIIEHFASLPLLTPDRQDHIAAAGLRNTCRQAGIQIGTIDALLAQLCVRHKLMLLSTDRDFSLIARHAGLRLWSSGQSLN
jgi:predicted nucleic acid-binding protein